MRTKVKKAMQAIKFFKANKKTALSNTFQKSITIFAIERF